MLDKNGLPTYSSKEEIAPISRAETVPAEYVMKYNTSGEAVRNVKAKESNYFNILQTIAETF